MVHARLLSIGLFVVAGCGDAISNADAGSDSGGQGPFVLAAGAVAELPVAGGAAAARLATPSGSERFLVVLASTRFDDSGASLAYDLTVGANASAAAAPTLRDGCSLGSDPWSSQMLPIENEPTGTAPAVGATRDFKILVGNVAQNLTAQVIATSAHAVVWADVTASHPANLDPAFVAAFLSDFDQTILPRERAIFGIESDIDGDGRIGLVFTPLTYQSAVAFFTACDLANLGCPANNHGEFLYLTPPATIPPPYNTPTAIKEIIAHECSHLIHYNRKVLRNQHADWADSGYMIEGFGALAQDVIGYQAGNLYVTVAGLDSIDEFSLGDVLTDGAPYDQSRDGPMRGGSYLFVRWLYDRGGGDLANGDGTVGNRGGIAFIRALLDASPSVAEALPLLGKATADDIALDFYTAVAMSNREEVGDAAAQNPCFRYLPTAIDPVTTKQRGADLFAQFHGMMMNGPAIQPAAMADHMITAGGVEYLEVDAVAGQPELDLTLQVDPTAMARVRVGRIR